MIAEIISHFLTLFKRSKDKDGLMEEIWRTKDAVVKLASEEGGPKAHAPAPPPPPLPSNLLGSTPKGPGPPPPPPPFSLKAPGANKLPLINGLKSPSGKAVQSEGALEIPRALKPKAFPPEGKKLRQLQWTKLHPDSALNINTNTASAGERSASSPAEGSVWQRMERVDVELSGKLDFSQLVTYFSTVPTSSDPTSSSTSLSINPTTNSPSPPNGSRQVTVSLVSSKRSLSINIYLKMDKDSERPLVDNLKSGAYEAVGLERMKLLLQLLPSDEEQKTLRNYTGDKSMLGQAERFLLELISIPHYKWRLEAAVFMLEFHSVMADVGQDLGVLLTGCGGRAFTGSCNKTDHR